MADAVPLEITQMFTRGLAPMKGPGCPRPFHGWELVVCTQKWRQHGCNMQDLHLWPTAVLPTTLGMGQHPQCSALPLP